MGKKKKNQRNLTKENSNSKSSTNANETKPTKENSESNSVLEPITSSQKAVQNSTPKLRVSSNINTIEKESFTLSASKNPSKDATEHLHKEMKKIIMSNTLKEGISIEPVEDNIFEWDVIFTNFDKKAFIFEGLKAYERATGNKGVMLKAIFPPNYPASPPFIRVVYPRFQQYTGHVTIGGSVCIFDLTTSGWNKNNEVISFFVMLRNLLVEGGAIVDMSNLSQYSHWEAKSAFDR